MMNLPKHNCGLYLEHNACRDYYETVAQWLHEKESASCGPDWASTEARTRAVAMNEVWTLQWYPKTPIGFLYVAAPTLDELVAFALITEKENAAEG